MLALVRSLGHDSDRSTAKCSSEDGATPLRDLPSNLMIVAGITGAGLTSLCKEPFDRSRRSLTLNRTPIRFLSQTGDQDSELGTGE